MRTGLSPISCFTRGRGSPSSCSQITASTRRGCSVALGSMTSSPILLRQWRDDDVEPYAEMNADPEVMRFFPKPLTKKESKESLDRLRSRIDQRGWGLWVVEVNSAFAGYTGLAEPTFSAHFTPCVEIGWRLRREYWGRGIAYAAALTAQTFAFERLMLPELVSFTSAINTRSRRLMERQQRICRVYRSRGADVLSALYAMRRDRLEVAARVLGAWYRICSGIDRTNVCIREADVTRTCVLYFRDKHSFSAIDGATWI